MVIVSPIGRRMNDAVYFGQFMQAFSTHTFFPDWFRRE